MSDVKKEFPDFDGELPEIEGFRDSSWHNDACPSLMNEEMHLILYVDFVDPELSDFPGFRKSGDLKRYTLHGLDDDNQVMEPEETIVFESDDLNEILAEIQNRRGASPTT